MKRCIIFFFYDKDGIADRYIFNMLDDLKDCAERILFVCNGKLAPQSRDKLEPYGVDIITRENTGMDVWAYKEAMEYLGWETICGYDELVMMNFTIFPSAHSFREMFRDMDGQDVDFWGATLYFGGKTQVAGEVPDHINSHFIAVRRTMLRSFEFRTYWETMPEIKTYKESVGYHESKFTKRFSEYGFRYKVYAPCEELRELADFPVNWNMRYVMENTKLPFIKRKPFFSPPYDGIISKSYGEAAVDAFRYLEQCEGYDSDAIWENILRTASLSDIKNAMQLNCILPSSGSAGCDTGSCRIGVMLWCNERFCTELFRRHFEALPDNAQIHVFSPQQPDEELSRALSGFSCEYHRLDPGDDPAAAILDWLKESGEEYDYILSLRVDLYSIESRAAVQKAFDSLLTSREHVGRVINEFRTKPRLGMLFPPTSYTRSDSSDMCREWVENKNEIIAAAEHLGLTIDEHTEPPAPYAGMYWCRGETMRSMIGLWNGLPDSIRRSSRKGKFSLCDSMMSLLAQKAGFYSSWLFNEVTAAIEITNLYFMLNKLISCISEDEKMTVWQLADKVRKLSQDQDGGSTEKAKRGLFGAKKNRKNK